MKICFATNNLNKLKEIRSLAPSSVEIVDLKSIGCQEELPETHETMEENSLEKAEFVLKNYGIPCFADDSGLEVKALDGEPGVYSARYAGPQRSHDDNIELLLKNLSDKKDRSAQFKSVITFVDENETKVFEGISKGKIIIEKRGRNGFGYDPVFIPENDSRTYAEMSMDEKNKSNHRAKAFESFIRFLKIYQADKIS